jgi:cell division septal protein FtsQ
MTEPRRRWPWLLAASGFVATTIVAGLAYAATAANVELPELREKLRTLELRRVEFVGLERLDAVALWRHAKLATGTALIDVDGGLIAARIAEHPRVETCAVLRLPPDRLLIGVRERTPTAVDAETGDGVDEWGASFPLVAGEAEALPQIEGSVQTALPLLHAARELRVRIRSVHAYDARDLRFRSWEGGIDVRVGPDARDSLVSWIRLRESGLIEKYGAHEVDLRFAGSAVLRDLREKQGGEDGTS